MKGGKTPRRRKESVKGRGCALIPLTLHYRQLALSMDDGGEHHLLWAQEPISGWCFGRIYSGISPALVDIWLTEALNACPAQIQCLETYAHIGLRADTRGFVMRNGDDGGVRGGTA